MNRENSTYRVLSKMSKSDIDKFHAIVREELEKRDLYWDWITSRSRLQIVTDARWAIIWRVRNDLGYNPMRIARLLNVDRTTVLNALKRMNMFGTECYIKDSSLKKKATYHRRSRFRKTRELIMGISE